MTQKPMTTENLSAKTQSREELNYFASSRLCVKNSSAGISYIAQDEISSFTYKFHPSPRVWGRKQAMSLVGIGRCSRARDHNPRPK